MRANPFLIGWVFKTSSFPKDHVMFTGAISTGSAVVRSHPVFNDAGQKTVRSINEHGHLMDRQKLPVPAAKTCRVN